MKTASHFLLRGTFRANSWKAGEPWCQMLDTESADSVGHYSLLDLEQKAEHESEARKGTCSHFLNSV
jgi:hypothetical protein